MFSGAVVLSHSSWSLTIWFKDMSSMCGAVLVAVTCFILWMWSYAFRMRMFQWYFHQQYELTDSCTLQNSFSLNPVLSMALYVMYIAIVWLQGRYRASRVPYRLTLGRQGHCALARPYRRWDHAVLMFMYQPALSWSINNVWFLSGTCGALAVSCWVLASVLIMIITGHDSVLSTSHLKGHCWPVILGKFDKKKEI